MRRSFKYLSPVLVTGLIIFSVFLIAHRDHSGRGNYIKYHIPPTSYSVYKDMLRFLIPAIKS